MSLYLSIPSVSVCVRWQGRGNEGEVPCKLSGNILTFVCPYCYPNKDATPPNPIGQHRGFKSLLHKVPASWPTPRDIESEKKKKSKPTLYQRPAYFYYREDLELLINLFGLWPQRKDGACYPTTHSYTSAHKTIWWLLSPLKQRRKSTCKVSPGPWFQQG